MSLDPLNIIPLNYLIPSQWSQWLSGVCPIRPLKYNPSQLSHTFSVVSVAQW